jgi:CRISPR-associated protein Cas5d
MHISVQVWSKMGCFSMPEYSVERMSYPCLTFSAAAGMLHAIYGKMQEFSWTIDRIYVLNSINYYTLRFNELKTMPSAKNPQPISIQEHRTQRNTTVLLNPNYVISARVTPARINGGQRGSRLDVAKHIKIFQRRVKRGACFYRPYMGMRDFPAEFAPAPTKISPISTSMDLGVMPVKVQYAPDDMPTRFAQMRMEAGEVTEVCQ